MSLPDTPAQTIALSLVSHTNVGKTTLARTLLRRDVGEVRDEAHVTLLAESQLMIESAEGHRLDLWDTPGFGDSARLARRLAQAGNPLGWFMSQVWDRLRDRAFFLSQRAVRHVFERADVVLYLVNASEAPADAGYLDVELQLLTLLKKPVVVVLNQLGMPQSPADEAAEVARWRERMAAAPCVREVLALDAFARCWVQETALLRCIAPLLEGGRRTAFDALCAVWQARSEAVWQQSMQVLAQRLARAGADTEAVPEGGWAQRLKHVGASLGLRSESTETPRQQAERRLAERLADDVRRSTDALIALHGLGGQAAAKVLARLAEHYAAAAPASESKAAMFGGMLTGALAGLKADLLTGGLTMGGGLLAGGVIGALGAAGLARGYNLVRGVERPTLAWAPPVLDELAHAALLGYLAVAHHGRGRGDWTDSAPPAFWLEQVSAVLAARRGDLHALWAKRPTGTADAAAVAAFGTDVERWLAPASREVLALLYPAAPGVRIGAAV